MVFVFSLYIWRVSSYFPFQVIHNFTAEHMSQLSCMPNNFSLKCQKPFPILSMFFFLFFFLLPPPPHYNYAWNQLTLYTNRRTDIGVTCDVGVSQHSKTHLLFMKCAVLAQVQSVRHTCIQACFLCFFSNPYSYISFHLLVIICDYIYALKFDIMHVIC